jgi:quercetin dioxygenase-like cupin family protein
MQIIADAGQIAPVATPDGAQRRVLSHSPNMMLVHFTFDAGVTSWEHSHPHEQIGYVVSGEIDLLMAGQPAARLGPGCSYYVPPDVLHHIHTHTPAVLIDCFTPARTDFLV